MIARADTLIELMGRMSIWELRLRARVVRNLAAIASVPEDETPPETERPIAWNGPALKGSEIVPLATRGGVRAGNIFWAWHFTHDGRGLLTSHEIGGQTGTFAEQTALFAGVPVDLLTLVVDREPGGLYPHVTREGEPQGDDQLSTAQVLPNAKAVFFHDSLDWRAPLGMLRKAYAASIDAARIDVARTDAAAAEAAAEGVDAEPIGVSTVDPLTELYSQSVGVPQLQRALRAHNSLSIGALTDPNYARYAFSREVTRDEARAAFAQPGTALEASLLGDLNGLLDVIIDGPGYRGVLDATLSNTNSQHRRELAMWLLDEGVDPSIQLSFMTPINVLLENPTLEADDAVLLAQLLESGADAGFGLIQERAGGHPLLQLCDRDIEETELLSPFDTLLHALLESEEDHLTSAARPDGRSVLEYVKAGVFPHQRSRVLLLERLEHAAEVQRETQEQNAQNEAQEEPTD